MLSLLISLLLVRMSKACSAGLTVSEKVLSVLSDVMNLKPRLTASEACHRLALSEGQKEDNNKKEAIEEMERTMKRRKLSFITAFAFFAVFLLLASSSSAVYASPASSNKHITLPDFLIRFAKYKSKGNATEEARIINQMITQEQIKQEMIASTKGAVLTPPPSSLSPGSWIWFTLGQSDKTYDKVTGACTGYILNRNGLTGSSADGNCAFLWTNGWNHDYDEPEGGEAFTWGPMYNYWGKGNVYVTGYTNNTSWDNYVIIYVGNDPSCQDYLGYAAVTSSKRDTFWVNWASFSFKYMAVICWTPPPAPIPYWPLIKNSVFIDCVRTVT